jgi:tryptophanyl-tRNA synthetase
VPTVFSGIQPSGDLHLGNHLGALANWVAMQDTHDCTYCVVDMHAITVEHDPAVLRQRTVEVATGLLAVGIDPDRSTLFVQSHLGDVHAEATWLLNSLAGFGELRRQPQFKEKADRIEAGDLQGQVTAALFDYPVLQTADIILYHADEVPVGEDQRHHVELARHLAQRFNHRFCPDDEPLFTLPYAVHPPAAARVMDLQEPTDRMSKSSSSAKGIVHLLDPPTTIAKKIRSAVTDSGDSVHHDRDEKPGVSNLMELYGAATGATLEEVTDEFAGQRYGAFKSAVADAVVALLEPIQARHAELADDPGEVERLLAVGAERARSVSAPLVARAKELVGFLPAA